MIGSSSLVGVAQNCSSAAPGPMLPHGMDSIFETLSNTLPIDSSAVVASVWKEVLERARSRSVCPPEISRVRNGN